MDKVLNIESCSNYISSEINKYNVSNANILIVSNYDTTSILSSLSPETTISQILIDESMDNNFIKFPLKSNSMDICITILPSLELENPAKLLTLYSELIRVAKMNGLCIIIEDNESFNKYNLENELNSVTEYFENVDINNKSNELIGLVVKKTNVQPSRYNCVLNNELLKDYLSYYSNDQVLIDLLLLDYYARVKELPIVSSGRYDDQSYILDRSYRVWEYRQIIKGLELEKGIGGSILDLGGASCHLTYYAALKGYRVTSLDINPQIIELQQTTSRSMNIENMNTLIKDMRDLSSYPDNSFDMAMSASVFEHLTADDQIKSIQEIARVVKPGGRIAISFDYGIPAPGINPDLPPPHDPPFTNLEVIKRYCDETGLVMLSEPFTGTMFPFWAPVYYSPAFILLGKPNLDKLIVENTNDNWMLENSIMYPRFFDKQVIGRFLGYLIEKSEISAITNSESETDFNRILGEIEFDREERLGLINDLNKKIAEIETDREDRLNIINKQQEQIKEIEKDRKERLNIISKQKELIKEIKIDHEESLNIINKQQELIKEIKNDHEESLNIINKQQELIKEIEKDHEDRLKIIEEQKEELDSYKNDRIIKVISKFRKK